MITWIRTVTYALKADTLEEALEVWGEHGPECGTWVESIASSNLEAIDGVNDNVTTE